MSAIVETRITFDFTQDGTVLEQPTYRLEATSEESQFIFSEILPQAINFMEFLIWKHRKELKTLESK